MLNALPLVADFFSRFRRFLAPATLMVMQCGQGGGRWFVVAPSYKEFEKALSLL